MRCGVIICMGISSSIGFMNFPSDFFTPKMKKAPRNITVTRGIKNWGDRPELSEIAALRPAFDYCRHASFFRQWFFAFTLFDFVTS